MPGATDSGTIGLTTFLLILAIALTASGVFIAMASKRSVHGGKILAATLMPIVAIIAVPNLLYAMTNGKASLPETLPWVVLVAVTVPFVWLRWRTNRDTSEPASTVRAAPKPAPNTQHARARNHAPGPQEWTKTKTPTVFISYRRADSADVTGRLYDRLTTAFGRERVHKDVDSIPLGVDFVEHINELISECDVVLAVIGRHWLTMTDSDNRRRLDNATDPVRLEIVAALNRSIPVVPILVGGSKIPPAESLPDDIRNLAFRNGTSVRPDPDFHKDVDRLIAGLRSG